MIRRTIHDILLHRLGEKRLFLQILLGPRQVGKTTLARQVMQSSRLAWHYASADEPGLQDRTWIQQQWDIARLRAAESPQGALLVLDEIQKLVGWSDVVKQLWDADSLAHVPLRVILLGSAPLLVQRGLTESLAGRFEVIHVPHWSYAEMREAFGWNVDQYVFYGAYPGAAELISQPQRWRRYLLDSLIETTISRDVLMLTRVDKPALLRQLFYLGCAHSGQILSYQKMLGQLRDAGNTVTLAHYLQLLQGAGILAGLGQYSASHIRQRASSPKLQVLNTALMSVLDARTLEQARRERDYWGHLVESCVGAHLLNTSLGSGIAVAYWRKRNQEVDFVLSQGQATVAIEVKSSRRRQSLPGMELFAKEYPVTRRLLVGGQGIGLEEFLTQPTSYWMG